MQDLICPIPSPKRSTIISMLAALCLAGLKLLRVGGACKTANAKRGPSPFCHIALALERLRNSANHLATWIDSNPDILVGRDTNEVWLIGWGISEIQSLLKQAEAHLSMASKQFHAGKDAGKPIRLACECLREAKRTYGQASRSTRVPGVGHISIPFSWDEKVASREVVVKVVAVMKPEPQAFISGLRTLLRHVLRWLSLTKGDLASLLMIEQSAVDAWLDGAESPDPRCLRLLDGLREKADRAKEVHRMIDCIRLSCGLTETTLAERLKVAQSTISKWSLGRLAPSDAHMRNLRGLLEEAHDAIAQTLLRNTNFVLECNFAEKYPPGFPEEAKRRLERFIDEIAPVPAGPHVNLLIRSADLPEGVQAQCFSDGVRNPRTFLVLVSNQLPLDRQTSVGWDEVYAHVVTRTRMAGSKRPEPTPLL